MANLAAATSTYISVVQIEIEMLPGAELEDLTLTLNDLKWLIAEALSFTNVAGRSDVSDLPVQRLHYGSPFVVDLGWAFGAGEALVGFVGALGVIQLTYAKAAKTRAEARKARADADEVEAKGRRDQESYEVKRLREVLADAEAIDRADIEIEDRLLDDKPVTALAHERITSPFRRRERGDALLRLGRFEITFTIRND